MLLLLDSDGQDIAVTVPRPRILTSTGVGAVVGVSARLIEDDADLPLANVKATLDWDDGTVPEEFTGSGTLAVSSERVLRPGSYYITLNGENFRGPQPETTQTRFQVTVRDTVPVPAKTVPLIYGPILPRDTGTPNAATWSFDSGEDIRILESSVKMLLTTAKGERLMEPEYGTNIRKLIFENSSASIESIIEEELSAALSRWEPRVDVQGLSIIRGEDRSVIVSMVLVSKLSRRTFESVLSFASA